MGWVVPPGNPGCAVHCSARFGAVAAVMVDSAAENPSRALSCRYVVVTAGSADAAIGGPQAQSAAMTGSTATKRA